MENIKVISIIIPCYNVESYIFSLYSMLEQQTYSVWEAICINDGSIDRTEELLLQLAENDSRIKVYSQSNRGVAQAREKGIKKAVGDYITFLDADDTLAINALELLMEGSHYNADIVVSSFNIIYCDKAKKIKPIDFTVLDSVTYLKKVLHGRYGWELCAKAYKRELFNWTIKTPKGIRIGEDAAVFIQLVVKAKKIIGCSQSIYNYVQYDQSASHVRNITYAEETLKAACFIECLLERESIYAEIRNDINAMFLLFFSNSTRKAFLDMSHPLMKKVKVHMTLSALMSISCKKAIYILLSYYFLPFIFKLLKK